jgi:hypothetical protein
MDIDLQIYLKSLRDFFKNHSEGREALLSPFPGVEFDTFMTEVERVASTNYHTHGDPTISKKQIIEVLHILHAEIMGEGLQELIKEGKIDLEKGITGTLQVKLSDTFKKEMEEAKIFQPSTVGKICLN